MQSIQITDFNQEFDKINYHLLIDKLQLNGISNRLCLTCSNDT